MRYFPPRTVDLDFLSSGTILIAAYSHGIVVFYNLERNQVIHCFSGIHAPISIEMTPDGWLLLTNNWDEGIIRIWGLVP